MLCYSRYIDAISPGQYGIPKPWYAQPFTAPYCAMGVRTVLHRPLLCTVLRRPLFYKGGGHPILCA